MNSQEDAEHFEFGKNWQSYVELVDEDRIAEAEAGLLRLVSREDIKGRTFFDIGCGSGLSLLAALRLGAVSVRGIDIDPDSVSAAHALLSKFAPGQAWQLDTQSIFELDSATFGAYDVTYSWGVLHHTGNMWEAIERAASLVSQGGLLVIAIYHKTLLCGVWREEKRIYSRSGPIAQKIARVFYKTWIGALLLVTGRNPWKFVKEYKQYRGMDWNHDVHDWLGGYPYESATPDQVKSKLAACGLAMEKVIVNYGGSIGLSGSGCDEFVARRLSGGLSQKQST